MSAGTIALVVGWIVSIVIAERAWPALVRPAQPGARLARNLVSGALATGTAPLILTLVGGVGGRFPALAPLPALLPPPWALVAQFVALDLWTYWQHRLYHRLPLLWRLHAVHHLDAHLDASSAVRFHLCEIVLSGAARVVPALLFGIDAATMLAFETVLLAATVFHHSNLRLPRRVERGLASVVVTPAMHRLHHHARQRDTDSNYTSILSLWDRLFGSFNPGRWEAEMRIGVEGERERGLGALLLYPAGGDR